MGRPDHKVLVDGNKVMVTVRDLVGIAGLGGVVIAATGMTMHHILQQRVRDSPVLKEVIEYVNKHPGLDPLFGKPIKNHSIDLGNKFNVLSLRFTRLQVPVEGPKNKGKLTIIADRLTSEDKWNIYKIELEFDDKYGGKVSLRNKAPLLEIT